MPGLGIPVLRGLPATTAFRWTLAIAGGFTAMALLLFSFIYWQTAVREREIIDGVITREAAFIATGPATDAAGKLDAWVADDVHDVRYAGLFDRSGERLAGALRKPPAGLPADGLARQATLQGIDHDRDGDDPEVVRAIAVRLDDGSLLVLGYDIDELETVQSVVLRALILGLVPMVLLALLAGTLLAMRAQRRLASVHEAIGRIMMGQLSERLPVRSPGDDLDRLAGAVNGMLSEIQRLIEQIHGIGNNIAHDLRTPLTRVRTRLERSRDEARTPEAFQAATDRAITSVDQALAVVSAVLRIGEIEHGRQRAAFGPVALAEVLRDAAELYEPLADEKDVTLTLRIGPAAAIFGDRDLLLEAIGNLVDNAVKFAPPGTEVSLSLVSDTAGARFCVADQGPGIPLAERERVLQRFYRADRSRTVAGSGLGLSMVSAVLALHGFQMHISDADPGCKVEVTCPAILARALPGLRPVSAANGTATV
jgi:signal transduction histidine kinase